jgi:hypothetical protein
MCGEINNVTYRKLLTDYTQETCHARQGLGVPKGSTLAEGARVLSRMGSEEIAICVDRRHFAIMMSIKQVDSIGRAPNLLRTLGIRGRGEDING